MTDRETIIARYEQEEARQGGPGFASAALDATAEALGLPREDVRNVLLDHWTASGGG